MTKEPWLKIEPNRPNHDDFWLMSAIVQDIDAASEDVGFERTIGNVDPESLCYVAEQRALRVRLAQQIRSQGEVEALAAAWIDGFVAGREFNRRKS